MSKELQRLKCGGKKKKKFSDGTLAPISTAGIKFPTLAPKVNTSQLVPMSGANVNQIDNLSGIGAVPFAEMGNIAGNYLDSLISGMAKRPTDVRENPLLKTLRRDNAAVAGNIVGNTAKGAGIGAAIGSAVPVIGTGIGAAVGAGIGALSTTLKKAFESKAKKEARLAQTRQWNEDWLGLYNQGNAQMSYADGGPKYTKTVTPLVKPGTKISTSDPRYKELYNANMIAGYDEKTGMYSGKTLPEVSVTAERPMTVGRKLAEEYKDSGPLHIMTTMPFEAALSVPQLLATKAITGKVQRPSEALKVKSKVGKIATDMALDPMNLVGAGIGSKLLKEKGLLGNTRKIDQALIDEIASGRYRLQSQTPEEIARASQELADIFAGPTRRPLINSDIPTGFERVNPDSYYQSFTRNSDITQVPDRPIRTGRTRLTQAIRDEDTSVDIGNGLRKRKEGENIIVYDPKTDEQIAASVNGTHADGSKKYTIYSRMPSSRLKAGRAYKALENEIPKGSWLDKPGSLSADSFRNITGQLDKPDKWKAVVEGFTPMNNMAQHTKVGSSEMFETVFDSPEQATESLNHLNSLLAKHPEIPKPRLVERPADEGGSFYSIELPNITLKKLYTLLGITAGGAAAAKSTDMKNYKNGGMLTTGKKTKEIDEMTESYASGGKVKGKGGPKEDAITKKVEDGSFIVPAENANIAMSYGKEYLGWDDKEQANRNYPGTQVKLSNGEVLFTPEEVQMLTYHGVDLNSLAPNATEGIGMATGGTKHPFTSQPTFQEYADWYKQQYPGTDDEAAKGGYEADFPVEQASAGAGAGAEANPTFWQKLGDYTPEIAGLLQTGMAINADRRAGSMPDINVSAELKSLSKQARKEAEYGLEPGAKNAMLNAAETERRNATNAVVNRGGSSAEIMSNLQGIMSTATNKKYETEITDNAERARKQSRVDSLVTSIAGQEMDIQKEALRTWRDVQDVNANLLMAGISNIVGSRKLRAEMEAMKNIKSKGGVTLTVGGKEVTLNT
jgi:hypothetical protein